jgi:hypothetical protein
MYILTGSAASSHSYSPERKLEIEGGRQVQRHQQVHQHKLRPRSAATPRLDTSLLRPSDTQQHSKAVALGGNASTHQADDQARMQSLPRPTTRAAGSATPAASSIRRPQSAGPGAGRHGAVSTGGRGRSAPPRQQSESSLKLSLRKAVANRVQAEMQGQQHKQRPVAGQQTSQQRHPPAHLALKPDGSLRPESPPWRLPGKNPVRGESSAKGGWVIQWRVEWEPVFAFWWQ